MDCAFFLLLGCWISWTPVITLGGIVLMSNTSLNCSGPIQFTCVGTDIPNTLIWRVKVNDTDYRGEYAFVSSHNFPRSILLSPSLPGVEVLVINVSISNQFHINIASTLTSAAMLLNGATIQCADGANVNSTVYHIDIIAPPTRPFLECSLVISPGGVIVFFGSFSSGNNVTNYRVIPSPTPSSCPSDQLVSPSEDYSCSGLVLGTNYSFNVGAINCGNQEGPGSTIIVQPQVPLIPEIVIFHTYNDENSLSQLTVTWQVKHLSISDVCSFDNSLKYSIFLEDGRGRLEGRVVNSDSCNNNLCSTSFNTSSSSNQSYLVSSYAVNVFGRSNTAESTLIGNSLQSSLALSFKDCVTTLLCSSVLTEGICVVQYGQDSSYENFDNHLNVSLNSSSPLPLIDAVTQYYFQVEVRVNSTFYRSRRSFMTGEFPVHLTDTNIGLLIIGILFLILGILTFIVWISLFRKCDTASDKPVSLVLLLVAVFLWLVSVCLWIAVGGVVGQQRNTCDSEWQSNRDNLIIAAFVLSFISLLLFITSSAVAIYKKVHFKKKLLNEVELEEQENALDKIATEKPTWNPDTEMCEVCQKNLTQKFKRHHCRACGKIVKEDVDGFESDKQLPCCILNVHKSPDVTGSYLEYHVDLIGAKKPHNFFVVSISPYASGVLTALATPPRGHSLHSPPPSSPNPLLQKPTLKDLTSELYTTVASKWEIIGIQLQLNSGKLDTLKAKDDEAALIEVLKMWLRTVDPPPTWKAIIDAVRLFDPSLAASLTTKYCT